MTDEEINERRAKGVRVLSRRHIEGYLFDDEVLAAFCVSAGKPEEAPRLLEKKAEALSAAHEERGKPADDVKSAVGDIHAAARVMLGNVGKDPKAFMRIGLAPLLKPGMKAYEQLKTDIFGEEKPTTPPR